jgi:hypothetical protein
MGVRGEVFSTRVMCEGRTYFFNVKENRTGDLFLAIVESKPTETETFERRSIVIFKENMQEFLKSFEKALSAMEKVPARKPVRKHDPSRSSAPSSRSGASGHTTRQDHELEPTGPRQRQYADDGTFSLMPAGPKTGSHGSEHSSGHATGHAGGHTGSGRRVIKKAVRPRSADAERKVPRPPAEEGKAPRRATVRRSGPPRED